MGSFSVFHWIVVIGVIALLFGRGKISGLMSDVAQGIKSFKKGMAEDEATDERPARSVTVESSIPTPRVKADGESV